TSTRHPMQVTVKAGANKDGKLTALQLDVLSNTGAYGNHAGPVLFHSVLECISVYNCPNKKVDGVAAYTNTVPAGAFRGYGLPQTLIAGEAAIDELAKQLGISPFETRRRNVARSPRPRWRPASIVSVSCNPTPRMAATTPAPMAAPGPSSPDARRRPRPRRWPANSSNSRRHCWARTRTRARSTTMLRSVPDTARPLLCSPRPRTR